MLSQKVKIVEGGKLVIPARFRRELGLFTGDTVMVELGQGELRVRSWKAAIAQAQSIVREFAPVERVLSDELIVDRRAEAERE